MKERPNQEHENKSNLVITIHKLLLTQAYKLSCC
jgi:hypothetical protein